MLLNFLLKILFIYASYYNKNFELDKICDNIKIEDSDLYGVLLYFLNFYNLVLSWAVFTQQETNFTKNNLSFIDVLSMLTLCDDKEFEDSLRNIY